jgi:hypothetical protein
MPIRIDQDKMREMEEYALNQLSSQTPEEAAHILAINLVRILNERMEDRRYNSDEKNIYNILEIG